MPRLVYFDCASGASGDMLLGALVDLGLPIETLRSELTKLPLGGYSIAARRVLRSGIAATKVDVVVDGRPAEATRNGHAPAGHHHHRGLRHILGLIEGSALAAPVKERSASLFRRLAEAEAAVHGTSPEDVHFHEVGAVDSIVDIVGAVVGLEALGAGRFAASALNVGTGTVTMDHGTFPVPPPATERLIRGVPVYGAGEGELLTPTGALVITAYASEYGPLPAMKIEAVGYGAGGRDTHGRPNVLRIVAGTSGEAGTENVIVIETEIDDMSPQLLGPLSESLLSAGALDAYFTAVQMKKGRPGVLITVLARPEDRPAIEDLLLRETTTLGVRSTGWARTVLDRETVRVETPFGSIGVKLGRRGDRLYNAQPEFDDCERAARASGAPIKEVWAAALAAFEATRKR